MLFYYIFFLEIEVPAGGVSKVFLSSLLFSPGSACTILYLKIANLIALV
jgi:hypothetical protein